MFRGTPHLYLPQLSRLSGGTGRHFRDIRHCADRRINGKGGDLHPLRQSTVINMIIATIGASILFKSVGRLFWPEDQAKTPAFTEGELQVTRRQYLDRQEIWVIS